LLPRNQFQKEEAVLPEALATGVDINSDILQEGGSEEGREGRKVVSMRKMKKTNAQYEIMCLSRGAATTHPPFPPFPPSLPAYPKDEGRGTGHLVREVALHREARQGGRKGRRRGEGKENVRRGRLVKRRGKGGRE